MDTFSHTPNTLIDNANVIFTSDNLDKSDELANTLKDLTINDAECYETKSAPVSDVQYDPTRNPETVNHTSNRNEYFMDTSNRDFEKNY